MFANLASLDARLGNITIIPNYLKKKIYQQIIDQINQDVCLSPSCGGTECIHTCRMSCYCFPMNLALKIREIVFVRVGSTIHKAV